MSVRNPQTKYQKDCYLTDELFERVNDTTPDWLDIKRVENIPVFVVGQERPGGRHFPILKDSIWLGEGRTVTHSYLMERSEYDGPVVWHCPKTTMNTHMLHGDIFLVNAKVILNLDFVNANSEMTRREKNFVWLYDQPLKGKEGKSFRPSLKCWMWVGREQFWEDQTTLRMATKKTEAGHEYFEWLNFEQFEIPDFLKRPSF
jgi:hypothetical protein